MSWGSELAERCKTVESLDQELKKLKDEFNKRGCVYNKLTNQLTVDTELLKRINICHRYKNWLEIRRGHIE